jgi:hypothetical protein
MHAGLTPSKGSRARKAEAIVWADFWQKLLAELQFTGQEKKAHRRFVALFHHKRS